MNVILSFTFDVIVSKCMHLSVNGLRNQVKCRQILGNDILLLQETNATGYREARECDGKFGGDRVWSFGTASSVGVTILFSKHHSWKLTDN